MKEILLGGVSILVAVIVLAIGGEIAIRVYNLFSMYVGPITLDREFGWRATPNYSFSGKLVDADGKSYSVDMQTNSAGFRTYGDPHAEGRKKVLILGDSFTHAVHVSNDKTYHALLAKELDIEVFALGVEGYGTLQEYMMLDEIIDDIQPDAVVLQFCPNDFINNHYDLEMASSQNNNRMRRPYFAENRITYKNPSEFAMLRNFSASYSRFLYFILTRLDRLNADSSKFSSEESSEKRIVQEGLAYSLFEEAVQVTEELLHKIRLRVPQETPVYVFSTPIGDPDYEQIKRISSISGVVFIDGTTQALDAAERNGITTTAADKAHWSNAGHQVVADVLSAYFGSEL